MQKRFLQCVKKVLWLTDCVKSGFRIFMVEISSLDDALWLGRPGEVHRDQMKTLIESNKCYTMREIANNHKISKSTK